MDFITTANGCDSWWQAKGFRFTSVSVMMWWSWKKQWRPFLGVREGHQWTCPDSLPASYLQWHGEWFPHGDPSLALVENCMYGFFRIDLRCQSINGITHRSARKENDVRLTQNIIKRLFISYVPVPTVALIDCSVFSAFQFHRALHRVLLVLWLCSVTKIWKFSVRCDNLREWRVGREMNV